MNNLVGDNAPSDAEFAKKLEELNALKEWMKTFGVTLSPEVRKRLVHARRGGEEHAQRTFALATKHGIQVPGVPLDGMNNDMRLSKAMIPFLDGLGAMLTLAEDTAGEAENEYWHAFLAYYGPLSIMAAKNPDLHAEYRATIDFLSTGTRKKALPPK